MNISRAESASAYNPLLHQSNWLQLNDPSAGFLQQDHSGKLLRACSVILNTMRLEKIEKKFDLFGIQTHPIPLNPHGLTEHAQLREMPVGGLYAVIGSGRASKRSIRAAG
jgi:hypothetical protein